jgi:hypothetical protein
MSVQGDIWLLLLKEGGKWDAAEASAAIAGSDRKLIAQNLRFMSEGGYLKRYERDSTEDGRIRYGVTLSCRVPRGVTMGEILHRVEQRGEDGGPSS